MPRVFPKDDVPELAKTEMEIQAGFNMESLNSMKQIELRDLCRTNGVSQCGTKDALAERLFSKFNTGDASESPPACTAALNVRSPVAAAATMEALAHLADGDAAPEASLAVALQMQKALQVQQEQIMSLVSQLGRLADTKGQPEPKASTAEAPLDQSQSLELAQEQPPVKKARGRPSKCTLPTSSSVLLESSKMAASLSPVTAPMPETIPVSHNELVATLISSPMEEADNSALKKPAWARFRVASGVSASMAEAESARTPARTPPGAKRSAVTSVQIAEPKPSQSLPEAKLPVATLAQRAESATAESALEAKTPVATAVHSAVLVSSPSSTLEIESPKTPARTPPGLLRLFPTAVQSTESTLSLASLERRPVSSAGPKNFVDFYTEVRSRFRLPGSGSSDAFAELGRTACQLLDVLGTTDAGELPAKRRRLSEADRALEHVLEVVSLGAVPANGPSTPASEYQPEESAEASHALALVPTPTRSSGSWRAKGDLLWARTELEQALVGVFDEGSDGTRTVTRQAVESWLDTPAADRIRALHLDGGCRRTAELITKEKTSPNFDYFIERALYEANICHAPLSGLRDAEPDEVQDMPKIYVAFGAFLNEELNLGPATHRTYLEHVGKAFKYDGKAPEEMATLAYIDFVKHTWEDALHNHIMASALSKFSTFWQQFGSRPFKRDADSSHVQFQPRSLTRRQPEEGDGSESALAASLPEALRSQIGDLPEGWRVHVSRGRTKAWTSPAGVWHIRRSELVRFLATPPPPPLFYVPPPERPPPLARPPSLATPEKPPRPERERAALLPLAELMCPLPKPGEPAAAEDRDRKLLPQVITTFMRLGNGRMDHRELTRKAHAMTLFKIVSESQRSFEALADPSFVDLVYRCAENKKNHGAYTSAMKSFREFWLDIGGYDGEYDVADREIMQRSLYVKPSLVDAPGECGHGGISGGDFCRWSKRWCETCGTVLRCGKHEEHSKEMCREVFWSKHRADGTPVRTIADFFGTKAAKKVVPVASDAASGAEQPTAD